jgi:DNA-binding PadR family transcriptional regulator
LHTYQIDTYALVTSDRIPLSATAKVILGMLAAMPRSGYEIKQLVDNSARFFWTASYGQIYPELKKLAKAGLVRGADAPTGDRKRTVYELTDEGEQVARDWIGGAPETFELRDEGLLELFFAGSVEPARAPGIARERAARAREVAERLREIQREKEAREGEGDTSFKSDAGSNAVLRYGIEMNEWVADWFERTAGELEAEIGAVRAGKES